MSSATKRWKHIRNVLVIFAPLWVGAVLVFGLIGIGYSLVTPDVFSARQSLIVRDEATHDIDRLGQFPSQAALRAAQESILEIAKNRDVVGAALRKIGPPEGVSDPGWPTMSDIDEAVRRSVKVVSPQGAQFGITEVVYLEVSASSKQRALLFCQAMLDSLTNHLREVRRVRADSVIAELTHARNLAKADLRQVNIRMSELKERLNSDSQDLLNQDEVQSEGDHLDRSPDWDEMRALYGDLESEIKLRAEQLTESERRLAGASTSRLAALSTSLVTKFGPPQVSDMPVSPGMQTMTLGSMLAGLIIGISAVFFVAPAPVASHGRRRWTDHVQGQNRRAEDRVRLARQMRRRHDDPPFDPSEDAPVDCPPPHQPLA